MSERDSSKLPLSVKAVYGTGQFVDTVSNTAINTFLLFYLNAVCGLSGALAGASLAIALVVDAFVDPLIGSISDNTRSRFGRRHPFMIGGLALIFFGLGLLFSIPSGVTGIPLFAYATLVSLMLRLGQSAFIVPYIALGAELSDDYIERSSVVGWRTFYSVFATLLPLIVGYKIFLKDAHIYERAAFVPFAWTCAAVMTALAALATFGTLGTLKRLHVGQQGADHPLRRLFAEVVEVFRNPSFRLLFSSVLIFWVAQGTAAALGLHGSKFFWKLDTGAIFSTALSLLAGVMAGLPLVSFAGTRMEKRAMVIWSLVYIVITQAGLPIAHIVGVLPQSSVIEALTINNFFAGIAISFLTVGFLSMMADAADEHELLFGARREGVYFAGLSFSTKAASGLGTAISGVTLDLIHFPADLAAKGGDAAHIAPSVVANLGLAYGIVPGALTFACIVICSFYRIDRKTHADIQAQLTQRRAQAPAELSANQAIPETSL